jgi:hypothetical protein
MKSPLRAEQGEEVVRIGEHAVVIAYDPDGESWYVRSASLPGLRAEAGTREELIEELPALIRLAAMP